MCIAKSPEAPVEPAGYAPEDGYKQFSVTKTDEDTGTTEVLQEPLGPTKKKTVLSAPKQTMIRI